MKKLTPKQLLTTLESLINRNELEKAEDLLKVSGLNPSYNYTVSAAIALKKGDSLKAEVEFLRAIELDSGNILAAGNLATLYFGQKKLKNAEPYAERAHKNAPNNENFARIYAACLSDNDKHSAAVNVLEPFAKIDNPTLQSLLAYAAVLRGDMRAEESLITLEKARELYPNSEDAHRGIADAYAELDPRTAAKAFFDAEQKAPDNLQIKWNASFVELRLRNFKRGWELYETGLTEKIGRIGRPLPPQAKGLPLVTDLSKLNKEKWTLFSAEQGLGDQILFFGALNDALRTYPKSVIIGEDRMISLIQRSFPSVPVYPYALAQSLTKQTNRINGVFPIGSLMKHYRTSVGSFKKNRKSYIKPNLELVEKYKSRITSLTGPKKLIGISWRGGYWERQRRTKSLDFELFENFFKDSAHHFISLQYGDVSKEREEAKKRRWPITFVDGISFKNQIDEWVALACACDRTISVSTAIVHFLGAAGKHVDILIGEYQAPFIWGLEEGKSLPYEHVFIHRQKKHEESEDFFKRIAGEIA